MVDMCLPRIFMKRNLFADGFRPLTCTSQLLDPPFVAELCFLESILIISNR